MTDVSSTEFDDEIDDGEELIGTTDEERLVDATLALAKATRREAIWRLRYSQSREQLTEASENYQTAMKTATTNGLKP